MDSRALLQHQLSTSHQIVKQCVNDIADGEAGRLPAASLSPVIWQVGHLAVSNVNFIKRTGVTSGPELPERYTVPTERIEERKERFIIENCRDGWGDFDPEQIVSIDWPRIEKWFVEDELDRRRRMNKGILIFVAVATVWCFLLNMGCLGGPRDD